MVSTKANPLAGLFDGVVMLTWSNWHTEMRSNRYHYGIRFARHLPVLFVQPDLQEKAYRFEPTEVGNLTILHIYNQYGSLQNKLLKQALREQGIKKPLLWVYNVHFADFIFAKRAMPIIYHATEDYFTPSFYVLPGSEEIRQKLVWILTFSNLLVTVSDGVKQNYVTHGKYKGETLVLGNGCDFAFWGLKPEEVAHLAKNPVDKVAFYQGGISHKIDFPLLENLATQMPDWEFWFCGEVFNCHEEVEALLKHDNVRYFGKLHTDEVRELSLKASVGLIPFVQNDWIIERSFPLKAFEYAACGLPVVTVPVKSLLAYPGIFSFAADSLGFQDQIQEVASSRNDPEMIGLRLEAARQHDYDEMFVMLLDKLGLMMNRSRMTSLDEDQKKAVGDFRIKQMKAIRDFRIKQMKAIRDFRIKQLKTVTAFRLNQLKVAIGIAVFRVKRFITILIFRVKRLIHQIIQWIRTAFVLLGYTYLALSMLLSVRLLRETLWNILRHAALRKSTKISVFFKDLLVLGVVRRAMSSTLDGKIPFRVIADVNLAKGSIHFRSVAAGTDLPDPAPNWADMEAAIRSGTITQMIWEHEVTDEYVLYPVIAFIKLRISLKDRVLYDFGDFAQLCAKVNEALQS